MSDSNEPKKEGASFQIKTSGASDVFSAKCSSVFNFDEVKLKTPEKEGKAGEAEPKPTTSKVDLDEFKGRESLYRVPENEWDRPRKGHREGQGQSRESRYRNEHDDRDRDRERSRSNSDSRPSSDLRDRLSRRRDDRESDFKRPLARGGHRGRGRGHKHVPGFWKNPEKYTKYSLKDVDLTSNRENSQAAFAFLRDLKKRKSGEEEEDKYDGEAKIEFKRPSKSKAKKTEEESQEPGPEKPELTSISKKCDPEKPKAKSGSKSKQMTLSHLMDEEEEDE